MDPKKNLNFREISHALATRELIEVRRDIHKHPELGHEEKRTTQIIESIMDSLGATKLASPTSTGGLYELDTGRDGPSVVYRGDLDALPIFEESDKSFASSSAGIMHACGHDGHVAIVIGVAKALASRIDALTGRFVFIFQPAEELKGGAKAMVEGGALETIRGDVLFSHHLSAPLPTGSFFLRPGVAMSQADLVHIHLEGKGGHSGYSAEEGNVILAAGQLVQEMSSVVSDMSFEGSSCACSPGLVTAGQACNVVPKHARIEGSLRTFSAPQRTEARKRLQGLCERTSAATSVRITLEFPLFVPSVVNDPKTTHKLGTLIGELGYKKEPMLPLVPSDDVSEFLAHIPGCHVFVGAAPTSGPVEHHKSDFDFDEAAIAQAVHVLTEAGARHAATDVAMNEKES